MNNSKLLAYCPININCKGIVITLAIILQLSTMAVL